MTLRSHAEIMAILNRLEDEVQRYLPDYEVEWYYRWKLRSGQKVAAYNYASKTGDELRVGVSLEFLEQAPYEEIRDVLYHEIAHTFNSDKGRSGIHGEDWRDIARALGSSGNQYSSFTSSTRQPRYIWRCADCGKEVVSVYKSKLPAEFISPCPARTNPPGSSHLNFYVRDEVTRNRFTSHPLTSTRLARSP